jgi:hypothetical protein
VRFLGVVLVEVAVHWALFLAGLFGCWLQGMLSGAVVKGMQWLVGLNGFGL